MDAKIDQYRILKFFLFIFSTCSLSAQAIVHGTDIGQPVSTELELIQQTTVRLIRMEDGQPQEFCSGFLLRSDKILSAAHCLSGLTKDLMARGLVFADVYDSTTPTHYKLIQITLSDSLKSDNTDLALLHLQNDSSLNVSIPLAIGSCDPGTDYIAAGFGYDQSGETSHQVHIARYQNLNETESHMANRSIERDSHPYWKTVKTAGSGHECFGDSGGPLFCRSRGRLSLVGVATSIINPNASDNLTFLSLQTCKDTNWLRAGTIAGNQRLLQSWKENPPTTNSSPQSFKTNR